MLSVECCCTSCRTAGGVLAKLPGAPRIVGRNTATHLVLYRKDRIHFTKGAELLKEYRLTPESATRRIIAICCNTPIVLDFTKGHWLSLYSCLWSAHTLPPIQMRTMTSDALEGTILSDDVPNHKRYAFSFFAKLLSAWVAMGSKYRKSSSTERSTPDADDKDCNLRRKAQMHGTLARGRGRFVSCPVGERRLEFRELPFATGSNGE